MTFPTEDQFKQYKKNTDLAYDYCINLVVKALMIMVMVRVLHYGWDYWLSPLF